MTTDDLLKRAQVLTSIEQVDTFIRDHPDAVLFKAGTCHRTDDALARLTDALKARRVPPIGFVRVAESRAASDHIARLTGIKHESPQVIVIQKGRAVFARDNWGITEQALALALDANFGPGRDEVT
jgi:bacillithiol system protein YtxJ